LRPDLPVLVLTNKDRADSTEEFLENCYEFLKKEEVLPGELVAIVKRVLGAERNVG
jgi:hypothetical protein